MPDTVDAVKDDCRRRLNCMCTKLEAKDAMKPREEIQPSDHFDGKVVVSASTDHCYDRPVLHQWPRVSDWQWQEVWCDQSYHEIV